MHFLAEINRKVNELANAKNEEILKEIRILGITSCPFNLCQYPEAKGRFYDLLNEHRVGREFLFNARVSFEYARNIQFGTGQFRKRYTNCEWYPCEYCQLLFNPFNKTRHRNTEKQRECLINKLTLLGLL